MRIIIKGFTLVELVMTIVIVSIIAIPLSLLICQYIVSFSVDEHLSYALQLARLELETVFSLGYPAVISGFFPQYNGYAYDLNRTVTYIRGNLSSAQSLKRIDVEVYAQGSADVLTRFTAYRARGVSF